jgi:hypothetical protein
MRPVVDVKNFRVSRQMQDRNVMRQSLRGEGEGNGVSLESLIKKRITLPKCLHTGSKEFNLEKYE